MILGFRVKLGHQKDVLVGSGDACLQFHLFRQLRQEDPKLEARLGYISKHKFSDTLSQNKYRNGDVTVLTFAYYRYDLGCNPQY